MKNKNLPVVYCEFSEEENLKQLIEESFRLYLIRMLAEPGSKVVSSAR